MKRVFCLLLSLLICFASLHAFAEEAPTVADVLDDILHMQPQDRAQLMELASTYMNAMGEAVPAQPEVSEPVPQRLEGDGFATPEDAAMEYLTGLKERDVAKMLNAFAFETYVEHFDLEQALEDLRSWTINLSAGLPNEIDVYRQLNVYLLYASQVQRIRGSLLSFQWEGNRDPYVPFTLFSDFENATDAYDFLLTDRSELLGTISDIEFVDPQTVVDNENLFTNERAMKSQDKIRQRMGADEQAHLCAALKMGGSDYYFTCSAARYGDKWYLYDVPGYVGICLDASPSGFVLIPAE